MKSSTISMKIGEAYGLYNSQRSCIEVGVSPRSNTYHLVAGRIYSAVKKGNVWLIPAAAERPSDLRRGKKQR